MIIFEKKNDNLPDKNRFEDQFCIRFRSKAEQHFRFQHLVPQFYPFLFLLWLLSELCLYCRVQPNKKVNIEQVSNPGRLISSEVSYLLGQHLVQIDFQEVDHFQDFPICLRQVDLVFV